MSLNHLPMVKLITAEWRKYVLVKQPSLVQVTTCCLDGAKPLSGPMLEYGYLDH